MTQGTPYQEAITGQSGSAFINDTAANSGPFGAITAISDTTFTTLTSGFLDNGSTPTMSGDLEEMALIAGTTIFGNFTTVTLATGSVIAYKL